MTALGWSLEQVTEVVRTLTELEAPRADARSRALLRHLEECAAEAQAQRQKVAEQLQQADRFIATLRSRVSQDTTAA
jgi:DNA-binding transcriptional MerR regulator